MSIMNVRQFFEPKSILLIGSSKIDDKCIMVTPEIFARTKDNLAKFKGKLFVTDVENEAKFPACDLAVAILPSERIVEIAPPVRGSFGGISFQSSRRPVNGSTR